MMGDKDIGNQVNMLGMVKRSSKVINSRSIIFISPYVFVKICVDLSGYG